MKAEGRDIGEVDLRIKFDAEQTWSWQCKGEAKDARREEAESKILEAIDFLGGNVDAGAIADEMGLNRSTVQTQLQRMREEGTVAHKLEKVGRQTKCLYSRYPTSSTSSTSSIDQRHPLLNQAVDDVDKSYLHENETNQIQGVDDVDDVNTRISLFLGMSLDEALKIYRGEGAPIIYLGHGENCEDLELLLNQPDLPDFKIEAIKKWLNKNSGTMARSW